MADNLDEKLLAELRAEIAARDQFIAVAAHELRNPMTPILGQVQLLVSRARKEQASSTLVSGLEMLELAIDHYVRRATTLLEISRFNAGRFQLELATFNLLDVVQACVRRYELFAHRAGCALICDACVPVQGTWDRLALEQVLDNLVSNAIRYGDGRPVEIELEAAGGDAVLRVIDHGIGIRSEDRTRIFERFERGPQSKTTGGFGIGLWLARKLVEAHAGGLDVDGEPGGGSTFTVRLPLDASGIPELKQRGSSFSD